MGAVAAGGGSGHSQFLLLEKMKASLYSLGKELIRRGKLVIQERKNARGVSLSRRGEKISHSRAVVGWP